MPDDPTTMSTDHLEPDQKPDGPARTGTDDLEAMVHHVIIEVLMVSPEDVKPETALINDLGAESIDFLDLVFQLEESLGKRIPVERWQSYLRTRLQGRDPATAITTNLVLDFARSEAARG